MRHPILCSCLFALLLLADPTLGQTVALTAAERDYLQSHPTATVCVDPDWEPFEIINRDGRHEGIAADLLRLAAQRAGLTLELVATKDWDESLAASKAGRCELLSFLNQTPKRDEWLLFTDPQFVDANVFITREEHPFIVDPASLTNETIVFPTGTAMEERVRRDYPNLRILTTDSEDQAIAMVSERKASMTMRSLIVAAYTIKKHGLFNLKIAGQMPNYVNNLRIGVRRDQPLLRDILNKAIASITPLERGRIVNDHVAINVQTAIDYRLIAEIVAGFALLLAVSIAWSIKLRRLNRLLAHQSHTDPLTGLPNRTKLNSQFPREIERASRHGRPLSIIMVDLDHFKQINDSHGHLVGDKVLIAFADIARQTIRAYDCIGRWGGEEFLVLCPETSQDQAANLAQRLCDASRHHDFPIPHGQRQTISAGVATLTADEDIDTLLHRADTALYQAKNGGRDRVCVG